MLDKLVMGMLIAFNIMLFALVMVMFAGLIKCFARDVF